MLDKPHSTEEAKILHSYFAFQMAKYNRWVLFTFFSLQDICKVCNSNMPIKIVAIKPRENTHYFMDILMKSEVKSTQSFKTNKKKSWRGSACSFKPRFTNNRKGFLVSPSWNCCNNRCWWICSHWTALHVTAALNTDLLTSRHVYLFFFTVKFIKTVKMLS